MPNTYSATFANNNQGKETSANFTSYGTAAVTVEVWEKTSTTNANDDMIISLNNGTVATFQLIRGAGGYTFHCEANGGGSADSPAIANATVEGGAWHHIAGVYDGTNVKIYLDAVEQSSPGTAFSSNLRTDSATPLGIACRASDNGLNWDGQLDDIRVWNDARTATEISDNYQKELVGNEAGLTLYCKLNNNNTDETAGYTINDVGTPTFTTDVPFTQGAGGGGTAKLMGGGFFTS